MTLRVATLSHGEIESGFFASFTDMVRLGGYCFYTKDVCEAITSLAKDPEERYMEMHAYMPDRYYKEMDDWTLEKLLLRDMPRNNESAGAFPLAFLISKKADTVQVAEYAIEADHFAVFLDYVAHGGFSREWNEKSGPEYARTACAALEKTRHPIFANYPVREAKPTLEKRKAGG